MSSGSLNYVCMQEATLKDENEQMKQIVDQVIIAILIFTMCCSI